MVHGFTQNTGKIRIVFLRRLPLTRPSYTDISSGFFPAAKERFKLYPQIDFATLDINKDPISQGFQEGEFDVIIAANVNLSDST